MSDLGMQLKQARIAKRMTQDELNEASGVSQRLISAIELGKSTPTIPTLERLARALGKRVVVEVVDDD